MKNSSRFSIVYPLLAGVSGAVAWTSPYFIYPLLPIFPPYEPTLGVNIHLVEHTMSSSLALVIATSLFLFGLATVPNNLKGQIRKSFSLHTIFVVLVGAAIGGAFTGAIGYGVAYSPIVDFFTTLFDMQSNLPEPILSIGYIFGAGIAAGFISSFSDISFGLAMPKESPSAAALAIALISSISALAGRIVVGVLEALVDFINATFFFYMFDYYLLEIIIVYAIGGFIFGILAWQFYSRHNAA